MFYLQKSLTNTFLGVVAEVSETGVDASPRADDVVGGCSATVRHDTGRPGATHAYANVIELPTTHQPTQSFVYYLTTSTKLSQTSGWIGSLSK